MTEHDFVTLTETLRPELLRIARRRCGQDYAEDAVQKTVSQIWEAGKWRDADADTVTRWLRQRAADRGVNELRSLDRFRSLQKESLLLGDKGCKHTPRATNSDGEDK